MLLIGLFGAGVLGGVGCAPYANACEPSGTYLTPAGRVRAHGADLCEATR